MIRPGTDKKKTTYFLSLDILAEMKTIAPARGLRSQNALVEEALRNYIAEFKRECIRKQYLEASRDPQFIRYLEDIEKAFHQADAETARMIQ